MRVFKIGMGTLLPEVPLVTCGAGLFFLFLVLLLLRRSPSAVMNVCWDITWELLLTFGLHTAGSARAREVTCGCRASLGAPRISFGPHFPAFLPVSIIYNVSHALFPLCLHVLAACPSIVVSCIGNSHGRFTRPGTHSFLPYFRIISVICWLSRP